MHYLLFATLVISGLGGDNLDRQESDSTEERLITTMKDSKQAEVVVPNTTPIHVCKALVHAKGKNMTLQQCQAECLQNYEACQKDPDWLECLRQSFKESCYMDDIPVHNTPWYKSKTVYVTAGFLAVCAAIGAAYHMMDHPATNRSPDASEEMHEPIDPDEELIDEERERLM